MECQGWRQALHADGADEVFGKARHAIATREPLGKLMSMCEDGVPWRIRGAFARTNGGRGKCVAGEKGQGLHEEVQIMDKEYRELMEGRGARLGSSGE